MGILAALVIGAIAGWLAGLIVRGAGFGLIGNIVVGIIGALVASWLLPQLGVSLGGSTLARYRQCHHRRGRRSRHPLAGQTRLTDPFTPQQPPIRRSFPLPSEARSCAQE